jgi:hypothetical protein
LRQSYYVAQAGFELMTFLPPPMKMHFLFW